MSEEFDFVESEMRPGLSVIEASAGTGKTFAISHLVPRLLLDGTAKHLGEILLVTFTKDAARELSDRVRRVFEKLHAAPADDESIVDPGVHRLRRKFDPESITAAMSRALLDLDRLQVSTIHSFCQRTLQTEGPLCGLPVVPELIPDANEVIDRALYDLWESRIAAHPLAALVATAMKWSLAADLSFVRAALPLENAEAVPAPASFPANLERLDGYAPRFTAAICAELDGLLREVGHWTKAGEVVDSESAVAALRDATRASDAGFLSAAREIARAEGWINGTKHRLLKANVAACEAVALAREVSSLLARLQWDFRNETLAEVRANVAAALRASRQVTYDGLIDSLAAALQGRQRWLLADRLRRQYRVALIDESQDTDARQFEIFRRVFVGFDGEKPLPDHRLVLIGDPKQAIYAFRGADVNTYLAARDQAQSIFRLTKTYRAPEPLVRAVNALFAREDSLLKRGLFFREGSSGIDGDVRLETNGKASPGRIEAWCVPDVDGNAYANANRRLALIADTVASEIVRLLNGASEMVQTAEDGTRRAKTVEPGDIAVLVNSHREAGALSDALLARSVPAIRAGDDDVMASDEARELLVLLRALHEPRRAGFRLAALGTRLLGRDHVEIRRIRDDGGQEDECLQKFIAWQEQWHRRGVAAAMARIDDEEKVTARLARLERGERRITNLRQIIDLAQAAALEPGRRPGHLVRWLSQEVGRASGRNPAEERQQQLESDADAVQIVTMHAAKGLEYPLVFCPFLWSSRPPKGIQKLSVPGRPPQLVDLDLNEDAAIGEEIERAALEDRLRLAYVAVTRAKVKVWILSGETCGARGRPPASALDWLLRTDAMEYGGTWREIARGGGRGARHGAGWQKLSAASGGEITVGEAPSPDATRWISLEKKSAVSLSALPAPVIPEAWRMTSFSALTREKNSRGGGETPVPVSVDTNTMASGGHSFRGAVGGAIVGTAVHDWIEEWDFSAPDAEAVTRHLTRFPLPDTGNFRRAVWEMLGELRSVRLPGLGCTIEAACPNARASEWHFQLPISESLSSQKLAEVFAKHGHPEYAAVLSLLPVEELAGYLHGFLDRIAFHDGRWGVIDWKTNNLGPGPADYQTASLEACARHSHYLLQAHLYLVALRRYLEPDAPIAGAWLVFLRGIRGGTTQGVLHIQPGAALMTALDALFAHPSEPASA